MRHPFFSQALRRSIGLLLIIALFVSSLAPSASAISRIDSDSTQRISFFPNDTSTDAKGQTTAYEYDAAGRGTKVTDAQGQISRYAYDANGNQVRFTDALGRVTQQVYDALNRRVVSILADNSSTTTVYDALGRKIEELDAAGYRKQWVYDALGRLITAYDALGQATSYTYDEVGNQLTQKDALNRVTNYAYDKLGRRVKRTLPMGQVETMTYDASGNALTRTDFKGKTTTFGYDVMNRLLSKAPDTSTGEATIRYSYTATGRRATMLDGFGTTSYSYDNRDRLQQKVQKFGTLTYTRDANGNVTGISSNNPEGGTQVSYSYDALNRLDTVNDANLGATNYAYDSVGNLSNFRTSNGVTQSYGYNTVNRLTALQATSFDTSLHQLAYYGYTLSSTGHRTGVTELDGRHTSYTYDPLWRLKTETISNDTSGKNGNISYTFDAVGNRLTRTSTVSGLASQTNTYDQNDRLGSDVSDANGNTTQATDPRSTATNNLGLVNDSYNYEDKLRIRNAANGDVIRNVYDGDGNLVCVITNGQVVSYVLDDQNPTGYTQVLEEVTGGANTLLRTYTYGHALLAQDQKNPTTNIWTATWYGYDGHGNVRFLTDSTGAITDRYTYDAFGVVLTTSGTTTNAYKYCGERLVDSLGLYNLRARMMNPMTGRFWTMDSYEGQGSDPASLHKYLYANADGVNRMDPSGYSPLINLLPSWAYRLSTKIGPEAALYIYMGYLAHIAIGEAYREEHPYKGVHINRWLSTISPTLAFSNPSLRPDIADEVTGEVYEIKSIYTEGVDAAIRNAVRQAAKYVDLLNEASDAEVDSNTGYTNYRLGTSWPLYKTRISAGPVFTVDFWLAEPGAIVYDNHSGVTVALFSLVLRAPSIVAKANEAELQEQLGGIGVLSSLGFFF